MDTGQVVTAVVTVVTGIGIQNLVQIWLGRRKIPAEIEVQAATATHERAEATDTITAAAARMVERMESQITAMRAEHTLTIAGMRSEHALEIAGMRQEFGRQLAIRDKLAARHRPWDGQLVTALATLGQTVPPPPPLVPETYDDTDPGGTQP